MTEQKQHFRIDIERRDKKGGEWENCCHTKMGEKAAKGIVDKFNEVVNKHHEYRIKP